MIAPNFSLPDQDNTLRSLSDYQGKWVVLYFYPKDDTPGCTKEACNFQENIAEFLKRNIHILGVSKDTIASHKKFANKYHLSFPLLSDPDKTVISAYNAWGVKKLFGKTYEGIQRKSYLISPTGEIAKIYEKVNPLTHAKEILREVGD